ncbi:MAG TPA: GntR family transcriptional regulator [Spirochaetia bacterium]|nr:GntR family transcriptional regulator [Spirochaetia bacterium]
MKLVKDPLYQQLSQILRQSITRGNHLNGAKFLTEREIAVKYGVSRATANKVLSSMVSEGLLEFRKGVGTFVKYGSGGQAKSGLVSFTENVRSAGKVPSTDILDFSVKKARNIPPDAMRALALGLSDQVYYLRRVRRADGIPMILEIRYLVASFCPNLQKEQLAGSLFSLLQEEYHLNVIGSDEKIQAVNVTGEEAAVLQVAESSAAFLVTSVGYITNEAPLWWERSLHRADGFELRCQVRPTMSGHSLELSNPDAP